MAVVIFIIILVFLILFLYLLKVIYFKGNIYKELLTNLTEVYVYGDSAPRGRIYDRNYNLLVDNKGVNTIYYNIQFYCR